MVSPLRFVRVLLILILFCLCSIIIYWVQISDGDMGRMTFSRQGPAKNRAVRRPWTKSNATTGTEEIGNRDNGFVYHGPHEASLEGMENTSIPVAVCRSTVSGPQFVADDRGFVCAWNERQTAPESLGCCTALSDTGNKVPDRKQYSCHSCDSVYSCCEVFEYCVSCCLNPVRGQPAFDDCVSRCRTNSKSVVHGNRYRRTARHCFGDGPPLKLLQPVISSVGENCDAACARHNSTCELDFMDAINNCESLNKHFPCRDCVLGAGSDQPSFVVASAPHKMHPKRCQFTSLLWLSCDGSGLYSERLCPCRAGQAVASEETNKPQHLSTRRRNSTGVAAQT
eukprot:GILJ01008566.1.p1 GENE.GILJ01008566.1~~GILJ01008566.1.p1  ORF type:complete len:339 (+),score=11.64 GILJ01008566.1:43-1059(+)